MRGLWSVLIGLVFIVGGLSGKLVLRGTNSGIALTIVGVGLVIYGIFRLVQDQGKKNAPASSSGSGADKPRMIAGQQGRQSRAVLSDHEMPVVDCAFLPDGRTVVSASEDKTLKLWDAASGAERATLAGHTEVISRIAISPDGLSIVSSSFDKTLRIWDVATGTVRATLAGHTDKVWGCAFSPDGQTIVSSSFDKTLRLWDAATGAERGSLVGHTAPLFACAFSPDGTTIVSASADKTLRLWDVATRAVRAVFTGHEMAVSDCAFSPDGQTIVSSSFDKTLRIWDVATVAVRATLVGHTGKVWGCAFSPDGTTIASASVDNTLGLWDATSGREYATLVGHSGAVMSCAFSPDGRTIVSAGTDKTLRLWDSAIAAEPVPASGDGLPAGPSVTEATPSLGVPSERASGWYYSKVGAAGGQQVGPLSWEQVQSLAQAGTLLPADLVWNPQLPQWTPAAQVQGLFPTVVFPGGQTPEAPVAQPGPQWASAQPGGPYAPYPGQAGPYSAPRRHSWLTWAIPVAMLVLIGLGLGLGLGLTRGHDHNPPIVTNGTTTTRPATVTTTSEAVTTTSKASTTTTITATGGAGMVDNPLPLGQEAQIGDWKVKVVGATLDATQPVLAALSSNPTPDSGSQYVLVKLEATNTGTGSATYFDAGLWGIIGSKGDLFESSTAWAPDDLYDVGETLPGGTASGNVLFMMDSDQVSGGLVGIADTGNPAQIVFFATTAVTTTTAAEVTTITSALPTYSEVVSTYPPDAALIQTEADILGGDDSGLQLGNIVDLAMVDGQFVYQSYGTKLTVRATITLEGKTYQPGAKLTVDKNLHWIEVSSWD